MIRATVTEHGSRLHAAGHRAWLPTLLPSWMCRALPSLYLPPELQYLGAAVEDGTGGNGFVVTVSANREVFTAGCVRVLVYT